MDNFDKMRDRLKARATPAPASDDAGDDGGDGDGLDGCFTKEQADAIRAYVKANAPAS